MRAHLKYLFIFLLAGSLNAQQLPQYTQFIFNKIGYNPAASGAAVSVPYEVVFGARTQWLGVSNNPKSIFLSFNYNFVPPRSYHDWHNVGVYFGQDQNGVFVHNDLWLSYSYHLFVSRKMVLSFGVFAGMKQYRLTLNNLDKNDPAVAKSASSIITIPDVIPGVRLSNKKFFADLSLFQLTIFKQKGIGGQIGSPSPLVPHYNISVGKKIELNDYNNLTVAVNMRSSVITLPSIELNIMDYYNKRVAFGVTLRGRNFVCGIIQFRLLRNLNVGLAYDFSINKMMRAAPSTGEIMISVSPIFGGDMTEKQGKRVVDECTF